MEILEKAAEQAQLPDAFDDIAGAADGAGGALSEAGALQLQSLRTTVIRSSPASSGGAAYNGEQCSTPPV